MRFYSILAIFGLICPVASAAQLDPNWSQREMERMQAQQERWDAQAERHRAAQERRKAEQERQAAQKQFLEKSQLGRSDEAREQNQAVPFTPRRMPDASKEHFQPVRTGNDLYRICNQDFTGDYTPANLQCMLYVGHIAFGEVVVKFSKIDGSRCFPEGVNVEQLKDVILAFLKDNPSHRHADAISLTVAAFLQAFPTCRALPMNK